MNLLLTFFNKPYPQTQNKWKSAISISLFISLFLYVFQPFGLQLLKHDYKDFVLLGYGLVTFIVLVINYVILPFVNSSVFDEDKWTVKKQILWLVWIVFSIGLGNYSYSILFSVIPWFGFKGFLIFMMFTIAIAIIPIVLITFISQNAMLKKNMAYSQEINASIHEKTEKQEDIIVVESGKQKININADNIIAIESEGNYINVFCIDDEVVESHMIRNTIKNLEEQLQERPMFFKCHRAYIINLAYVKDVKGNSQGFNVELKNLEKTIPVSRSFTKNFKNKMIEKSSN